jgi:protein-S-isoprenylcysteine O-methyltransferase Ste14
MEPIGKSPISVPLLIMGKVAMLFCWLFFLAKTCNMLTMHYDSTTTQWIGIALYALGLIIVILGFIGLGSSVSVGIPEENTVLKTGGIYQLSRNPMYLGGFIMCAGSCVYSIHIVNIILFAITFAIHHTIVLKEEQFLEKRFGNNWLDYKMQVHRYLGQTMTMKKFVKRIG